VSVTLETVLETESQPGQARVKASRMPGRSHANLPAVLLRTFAKSLAGAGGLDSRPIRAFLMRDGAIDAFRRSGNRRPLDIGAALAQDSVP
jgi:hypothetical protein